MSADSAGGHGATTVGEARAVPFRIFINYRRGDSGGYAGRLYDSLASHSDAWQVFMDIDTIEPGVDFSEVIDRELETCDVVVAMVGPHWLDVKDGAGRRRLDNPDDLVRAELEAALARDIRVIPALVQGAVMPSSDQLPEPLRRFARRNALELSDARWRYDVDRLVQLLERAQQLELERAQQLEEEASQAAQLAEQERLERERLEREQALREAAALEEAERTARERAEREAEKAERERTPAAAAVVEEAAAPKRRRLSTRTAVAVGAAALVVGGGAVAAVLLATGSSDSSSPDAIALPAPKPRIAAYKATPVAPVAGKPFDMRLSVVRADTGKPISTASTTCRARAGSGSLRGSVRAESGGRFHCAWNIPATAVGLTLAGEMRVVYKGTPVVRSFRMAVAPPPATLAILGQPRTAPARPKAGDDLQARVSAGWARKGRLVGDLDPASSTASCRAEVGGSALEVTKAKINARSVVCAWSVPSGAGGKRVYAVITVRSKGQVAKKSFSARVRSATRAPITPPPTSPPSSPPPAAPSPAPSPPPTAPEPVIPP